MLKHLRAWIDYISLPQELIGGLSICPFAKAAKFDLISTTTDSIILPEKDFEIIIFKVEDNITPEKLMHVCRELNTKYKALIFLPDHKERKTYINSIRTNNMKLNLILCQKRDNLNKAREQLKNTNYYSYWNNDYLKEIMEM